MTIRKSTKLLYNDIRTAFLEQVMLEREALIQKYQKLQEQNKLRVRKHRKKQKEKKYVRKNTNK